ncbi:carboxylating nicotinate-nucleotide diphosphorylase [Caulobacter sp. S45]|uniref:carboxylating nicotinate-nucleotide diphosphorylase n=1 Tax=Caulobacter sp. S45 TaxID=1641861 RepID=UPI00131B01CA|nr:carboxylating nicotinate-nucleotide diphosphorylase [Caulobacter sp. S45]
MTLPPPLPAVMIEPLVRAALLEDLGRAGDLTTDAIVPADATARAALAAREPGVVAGLDVAIMAFRLIDPNLKIEVLKGDGSRIVPGDDIAIVSGPARGLLTGERVALNFLGHLSGIASGTATIADAIAHTRTRVADTRKTTPGLRALQKHAVRLGGGMNHRFGLDDAVLIKDNHIAVAGGVRPAIERARAYVGHLVKLEVEVDTLAQLEQVLAIGVDAVLLDNMGPDLLRQAVAMVAGRAITEASGRITPQTAPAIAETGVDLLSAGWLTHSARVLDIGLDYRD